MIFGDDLGRVQWFFESLYPEWWAEHCVEVSIHEDDLVIILFASAARIGNPLRVIYDGELTVCMGPRWHEHFNPHGATGVLDIARMSRLIDGLMTEIVFIEEYFSQDDWVWSTSVVLTGKGEPLPVQTFSLDGASEQHPDRYCRISWKGTHDESGVL